MIPTFAVFATTAEFAATRASVKYSFVAPSAISSVSNTTTPVCPFTLSTGALGISEVKAKVPEEAGTL